MEFRSKFKLDHKFKIALVNEISNFGELQRLKKLDHIVVLNPELICSLFHVFLSIERALTFKRKKTGNLKTDIIYFSCESGKYDYCLNLHDLDKSRTSYILLFINNFADFDSICGTLGGKIAPVEKFSEHLNLERIKTEFSISEDEQLKHRNILGAVYNRLALKDVK